MAKIQLQSDCPCADTIVPNKFIDQYMPAANGEFVKIYLYLLRCIRSNQQDCSVSAIADLFNHTEKDVLRALNYWKKQGLLALESDGGMIRSIRLLDFAQAPLQEPGAAPASQPESCSITAQSPTAVSFVPSRPEPPSKRTYTPDEMDAFRRNPDISELFFIVETYMKHPLSVHDMNTILFWHEELHFTTELIVYLLEYCISKGHTSIRYMDKVALGWHENGITSVEQAKEDAAIHNQSYYGVMKALGITGRSLVTSEKALINKWTKDYAFDLPLIQEACSRTIAATHQPSFEYTDTILTNWHENHVHTPEDVKRLDALHKTRKVTVRTADAPAKKNAFNNFNQRTYDFDKLEELLLTTSLHG